MPWTATTVGNLGEGQKMTRNALQGIRTRSVQRIIGVVAPVIIIAATALWSAPAQATPVRAVAVPSGQATSAGANTGAFAAHISTAALHARTQPATPRNGLCTGTWTNVVSNVFFQRSKQGTVAWGFKLTKVAIEKLGPVVTVSMPFAYVNGKAITPPYRPHTEPSTYNFHGSIFRYHRIGDGNHTIATGNKLTLYWLIVGDTGTDAYRYITCKVPKPGQ
jgi:hypothetical protein